MREMYGDDMVWVERFIIKNEFSHHEYEWSGTYGRITKYKTYTTIYDRVQEKRIIKIDTGDEELNEELAEAILTMLNIKYMNKKE